MVKAGARILPYSVIGRQTHVEERAVIDGSIVWPNGWIGRDAVVRGSILGRNCHIGRNATRRDAGRARRQDRHHRLQQSYDASTRPSSRPTTSAASTRRRSTRTPRASIGRASSATCRRSGSPSSRDMRLSSPSLAAAFIDGARAQGADVVDYGMMGTDMMYFAVARDGHDGGAQITASHNPKQYNGIKMVRREAFPLSGDAGIGEIRDMIASGTLPPRGRDTRRARRRSNVLDDYVKHVMSFIDPAIIKPFNVVLDAGSGMAGLVAPRLFEPLPCRTTTLCFEVDGTFPNHEANPLIEENRRDIVERVIAEKADIGIAWDGDADRCFFIDGSGEFIAGDFITALLAEAFLLKHPGATIIYDVRASYAVKDIVAKYGGTALMNRVGHAFFKRRMREEERDLRRRGHRALLLPRQLLRRQRLHPGAAHPRADVAEGADAARAAGAAAREVLHLGRDQHEACPTWTSCRRRSTALAATLRGRQGLHARRHLGRVPRLALQRARRRTPSRCSG